jgi:hypothetical protein
MTRQQAETVWHRRHSMTIAVKNSEWAHYYLSAGANATTMAAFISIKDNPNVDAQYFVNDIPKAVTISTIITIILPCAC